MSKKFTEKLRADLKKLVARFPLLVANNFALAAISIFLIFTARADDFPLLQKMFFVGVLNFPLLLAAQLFAENLNRQKILVNSVAVAFSAIYFFVLPCEFSEFRGAHFLQFSLILIGFSTAIFTAPFLNRKSSADEIWRFGEKLILNFARAFFFAFALFLAAIACFFALDFLFEISHVGDLISSAFTICAQIVAPAIFLNFLPTEKIGMNRGLKPAVHGKKFTEKISPENSPNKFLQTFAKFVVAPFLLFYGGILFIYFCKILISQNWPTGGVAILILIFLAALFFANFVFFPAREKLAISRFRKVSFGAALPAVALLFVSIFYRVANFGFTENRVLILLFGAWFLFAAVKFFRRENLKIDFVSLSSAIFFAAIFIFPFCKFHQI